jgi:hypothetical protein
MRSESSLNTKSSYTPRQIEITINNQTGGSAVISAAHAAVP